MFCPQCRCEYRKGIEFCATCDVALVAQMSGSVAPTPALEVFTRSADADEALVSHCGFVALDDARHARDTLRVQGIRSDILIRYAAPVGPTGTPEEEYWLRVPASMRAAVDDLLGDLEDLEVVSEEGAVACSDCGKPVAEDENTCPHCGAQFE